jgi:hypothetical protein
MTATTIRIPWMMIMGKITDKSSVIGSFMLIPPRISLLNI